MLRVGHNKPTKRNKISIERKNSMKSKNTVKTSNSTIARPILATLTRDELRAIAKSRNIATGKSAANTLDNICKAIDKGELHFKAQCTVSFKPADGSAVRQAYFGKTLRTYVSGPGLGNDTWLVPANAVSGSPSDPNDQGI